MKKEELFEALGNMDETDVGKAKEYKRRKTPAWAKWTAIAACAAILVGAIVGIPALGKRNRKQAEGSVKTVSATYPAPVAEAVEGVSIPAVTLPDGSNSIAYDMIGLVVYKGQIYTQAGDYFGEDAKTLEALVGAHLGTAKGDLNEWSAQDAYATEFASTVPGEVYAVKGYDEGFRICIRGEIRYDEQEEPVVWIQFFDCLNGITLRTGKDLFEDRLRVSENTESVRFQTHADWDNGLGNMQTANVNPEDWAAFWEQVDACAFVNMWDPDGSWSNPENDYTTIYDTQNQTHLTLTMRDGTSVALRLIEGGYVGYQPLGWYFVRIPEEVFNPVYKACGGTH